MMDALLIDYRLSGEGYCPFVAIDFSDLFRFLHPKLDRSQITDWEQYKLEQIALHILFNIYKGKLILLPPYVLEFDDHMSRIGSYYRKLIDAKTPEEILKIMAIRSVSIERDGEGNLEKLFESFVALIDKEERTEDLVNAVDTFTDLYKKGKIVSLVMLKEDIDTDVSRGRETKGYFELILDLMKTRPERLLPNERDAEAALLVRDLFKKNIPRKKYLILISSTKLIRSCLGHIKVEVNTKSGRIHVPIHRDLYYVLLRFPLEEEDRTEAIKQILDWRGKLRKYINLAEALNREIVQHETYLIEEATKAYTELADAFWAFDDVTKKLGPKATVFSRISSPDQWRTRVSKIASLIDKLSNQPHELRLRVKEVLDTLDEQTKKLDRIFTEFERGCNKGGE